MDLNGLAQSAPILKPSGTEGEDRLRGSIDVPLNTEGHQQARLAAIKLANMVDIIYYSGLTRTKQTAEAIRVTNPQALMKEEDALYSICMGRFEGQPTLKVQAEMNKYYIDKPYLPFPGRNPMSTRPGESFNNFVYRLINFFQKVEDTRPLGQTILLVTHVFNIVTIKAQLQDKVLMNLNIDFKKLTTHDQLEPADILMFNPKTVSLDLVEHPTATGLYIMRHGRTDFNN